MKLLALQGHNHQTGSPNLHLKQKKKHPRHSRFCHIYYMPGRGPRPFTRFRWRDRSNSQLEEKAAQSDAHSDSESGDSTASQPSSEPPISRIKHELHRRNAQSARFPANPVCGSRAQRLPGRAHVPTVGHAGQTRLGTRRLSVGGGRCPGIKGVARVRTMPPEQEELQSVRDSSL